MIKFFANKVLGKGADLALGLGSGRECPICGWTGYQFLPLKHPRIAHFDAICPRCRSNERARLAYLVMRGRLTGTEHVLHFAPERCLTNWIRSSVAEYVTCDFDPAKGDVKVDIQDIHFEDGSFDLVWCSHVLEHVPDDRKAMRELHRIIRPGGTCLVQVPLWHEVTDEDNSITDKAERTRRFFQSDHVRIYGFDIEDRLEEAGFAVETIRPINFDPDVIFRNQIAQVGNFEVFVCTKAPATH